MGERVRLEREGAVAKIILCRPRAGNALDGTAAIELRAAVRQCATAPDVRALLLASEGRHFCVGGDMADIAQASDRAALVRTMVGDFHDAIQMLAAMDAPVICTVQGAAAGAGLSLVGASDYAISASSATFSFAYTQVGLSADGGASWSLPRLLGKRRFQSLALAGRKLGAVEAESCGLVNEVVEDDQLEARGLAFAQEIAAGPTRGYGELKRLLGGCFERSLAEQLDAEAQSVTRLVRSDDAGEAITALLARRLPIFRGC